MFVLERRVVLAPLETFSHTKAPLYKRLQTRGVFEGRRAPFVYHIFSNSVARFEPCKFTCGNFFLLLALLRKVEKCLIDTM